MFNIILILLLLLNGADAFFEQALKGFLSDIFLCWGALKLSTGNLGENYFTGQRQILKMISRSSWEILTEEGG